MSDLDSVADVLYGLDPDEFVSARSEYAAKARKAGDRELIAAIGRLRKPTVAAWMVNLLARERADELAALFDLGDALRAAQRRLSGSDLRTLSAQRRRAVAALERDVGALVAARGRSAGENALREVSRTLNAALADPAVAEQVRAGRLAAIVEPNGFGDLSVVPLAVVPDSPEDEHEPEARFSTSKTGQDPGGADRETAREEAERTARQAEIDEVAAEVDSAHSSVEQARAVCAQADAELARTEREVAELRQKLEHAEQQRTFARRAVAQAKREATAVERAVSAAEAKLVRVKDALQ